jgi:hypothetical protein
MPARTLKTTGSATLATKSADGREPARSPLIVCKSCGCTFAYNCRLATHLQKTAKCKQYVDNLKNCTQGAVGSEAVGSEAVGSETVASQNTTAEQRIAVHSQLMPALNCHLAAAEQPAEQPPDDRQAISERQTNPKLQLWVDLYVFSLSDMEGSDDENAYTPLDGMTEARQGALREAFENTARELFRSFTPRSKVALDITWQDGAIASLSVYKFKERAFRKEYSAALIDTMVRKSHPVVNLDNGLKAEFRIKEVAKTPWDAK